MTSERTVSPGATPYEQNACHCRRMFSCRRPRTRDRPRRRRRRSGWRIGRGRGCVGWVNRARRSSSRLRRGGGWVNKPNCSQSGQRRSRCRSHKSEFANKSEFSIRHLELWYKRIGRPGRNPTVPPNPSSPANPSSVLGTRNFDTSQSGGSGSAPGGPTSPNSVLGSQSTGSASNSTGPTSSNPTGGSGMGTSRSSTSARETDCGSAIAATGTPQIMTGPTGSTKQTNC